MILRIDLLGTALPAPSDPDPEAAPEEIAEIARGLRQKAGLSKEPTGVVSKELRKAA
jgi:hypothetical protein